MNRLQRKINIAIDGPAGAGKSTVARIVAASLGYVYVDTGAMYRAATWYAQSQGINPDDGERIARLVSGMNLRLVPSAEGQLVWVNEVDVTDKLRTASVNRSVPKIAQIERVRNFMAERQKQLAIDKGVVMDGRDIGTQVLPDAEVKIFLTANVRKRAERRLLEMTEPDMTLEQLMLDIAERDRVDEERALAPLARAGDAISLDSTEMTIQQVVDFILDLCRTRMSGAT